MSVDNGLKLSTLIFFVFISYAGADFGLLLLFLSLCYFFCFPPSGGFSVLCGEHLCRNILDLYPLPCIGGIIFVIRLCGDLNVSPKAVVDHDPLSVVLAAALFLKDVDVVDQFSEHRRSQGLHFHELADCLDEIIFVLLHLVQLGDAFLVLKDLVLQLHTR